MQRKQLTFTAKTAADIEVNTNFVLPKNNSNIFRRVYQYRKIQRDSTLDLQSSQEKSQLNEPAPKLIRVSHAINSPNYNKFLLSEDTQVNTYENLQSSYPNSDQQKQHTSKHFENCSSNTLVKNKTISENKYTLAVKQASRQLRNNLVQDLVQQITTQSMPQKLESTPSQPIQPFSQERLSRALRISVSQTKNVVKSSVADKRQSLNSLSNQVLLDSPKLVFPATAEQTVSMSGTGLPEFRPKSMKGTKTQRSAVMHPKLSQVTLAHTTNHQAYQSQIKLLHPTPASQKKLLLPSLPNEMTLKQTTPASKTNQLSMNPLLTCRSHQPPERRQLTIGDGMSQHQTQYLNQDNQLEGRHIEMIGPYEIFVPKQSQSKEVDTDGMVEFVNCIKKGYIQQAETALARVNPSAIGYQFNLGLLKLLQDKFYEAYDVLQEHHSQSKNAQFAKNKLDCMKVTKECNPQAQVNQNYFVRTYPISKTTRKQQLHVEKPANSSMVKLTEWDHFLCKVQKYRNNDFEKFVQDKKYFDKVLERLSHIADDGLTLIPNVVTKIIKDPGINSRDIDKIINVTKEKNTEQEEDEFSVVDKQLEQAFIDLINMQTTYCVGAPDPIVESYNELIEGLRTFNEKFDVETFCLDFLETAHKQNRDATQDLLNRYNIQDKFVLRARTFIMSCFNMEDDDQEKHDMALSFLLNVVREADEAKLKQTQDPERYAIENEFNHLVQDIIQVSRIEKGPGHLSFDDQLFVDRLNWHKDLSGRSHENFLTRILEITKQDLVHFQQTEKYTERQVNYNRIEATRCPKEIRHEIQRKAQKAWEDYLKKPLTQEQRQKVAEQVQEELKIIHEEALQRYQTQKNHMLKKQQEKLKAKQQKDHFYVEAKEVEKIELGLEKFREILMKRLKLQHQKIIEKRKKELEDADKDEQEGQINETESSDEEESKTKHIEFNPEHMKIQSMPMKLEEKIISLWEEHPKIASLRKTLYNIQVMCQDEQIIFDRDKKKLAPLMEKWGIEAESAKEVFEKTNPSVDYDQQSELRKQGCRPKIGHQISKKILEYLVQTLENLKNLQQGQVDMFDDVLVENFRFFSIIDKNVRLSIYKSCELIHYQKGKTLVENDVDETQFVYVVLQGRVDYMMFKFETRTTVVAATYREGEVFGDASIQKQFFDVLKCLSKDRNYLQTACNDVYTMRIPKNAFISAIFAEMKVELMFKILLFRQTPYFQELSPYSLIMFASICEVKDYQFGEIVVNQGEKPKACYLVAHGRCQSIYQYVENHSTQISQYARKVLHQDQFKRPFLIGSIDYQKYSLQTASEQHQQNVLEKNKKDKSKPLQKIEIKKPEFQTGFSSAADKITDDSSHLQRAYYHGIINRDEQNKKIQYENHIFFGDINQGQVFGVRTLLDYTTFYKQIQNNSIRFSEQLGINSEEFFETSKVQEIERRNLRRLKTEQVVNAVKLTLKFCEQCFEEKRQHCECVFKDLSESLKKKVVSIRNSLTFQNIELQSLNEEFDFSESSDSETEKKNISELPKPVLERKKSSAKIKQNKESIDDICNRKLIDFMQDNLTRSQTSIVVMSATAKLIVIRREDKTFLNESLKQSIDRVILDQDFKDFDRPLINFKEVQKTVEKERGWIKKKKKIESIMLRETQQNRKKDNKL